MNAASLCLHVGFFYREIELLGRDDICRDLYMKSALLENRQQRQANARFIIHQEKLVSALSLCGNSF